MSKEGDIGVCSIAVLSHFSYNVTVSSTTYAVFLEFWAAVFGKNYNFARYFGEESFLTTCKTGNFSQVSVQFSVFEAEIVQFYGFGDPQCPPLKGHTNRVPWYSPILWADHSFFIRRERNNSWEISTQNIITYNLIKNTRPYYTTWHFRVRIRTKTSANMRHYKILVI